MYFVVCERSSFPVVRSFPRNGEYTVTVCWSYLIRDTWTPGYVLKKILLSHSPSFPTPFRLTSQMRVRVNGRRNGEHTDLDFSITSKRFTENVDTVNQVRFYFFRLQTTLRYDPPQDPFENERNISPFYTDDGVEKGCSDHLPRHYR